MHRRPAASCTTVSTQVIAHADAPRSTPSDANTPTMQPNATAGNEPDEPVTTIPLTDKIQSAAETSATSQFHSGTTTACSRGAEGFGNTRPYRPDGASIVLGRPMIKASPTRPSSRTFPLVSPKQSPPASRNRPSTLEQEISPILDCVVEKTRREAAAQKEKKKEDKAMEGFLMYCDEVLLDEDEAATAEGFLIHCDEDVDDRGLAAGTKPDSAASRAKSQTQPVSHVADSSPEASQISTAQNSLIASSTPGADQALTAPSTPTLGSADSSPRNSMLVTPTLMPTEVEGDGSSIESTIAKQETTTQHSFLGAGHLFHGRVSEAESLSGEAISASHHQQDTDSAESPAFKFLTSTRIPCLKLTAQAPTTPRRFTASVRGPAPAAVASSGLTRPNTCPSLTLQNYLYSSGRGRNMSRTPPLRSGQTTSSLPPLAAERDSLLTIANVSHSRPSSPWMSADKEMIRPGTAGYFGLQEQRSLRVGLRHVLGRPSTATTARDFSLPRFAHAHVRKPQSTGALQEDEKSEGGEAADKERISDDDEHEAGKIKKGGRTRGLIAIMFGVVAAALAGSMLRKP